MHPFLLMGNKNYALPDAFQILEPGKIQPGSWGMKVMLKHRELAFQGTLTRRHLLQFPNYTDVILLLSFWKAGTCSKRFSKK